MLDLRVVTADDWQTWRSLRLQALTEAPQAFSATLDEWQGPGDTEDRWRSRLATVPFNIIAHLDDTASGMVSARHETFGSVELISMWVLI